jgi:hypothetical protein
LVTFKRPVECIRNRAKPELTSPVAASTLVKNGPKP